MVTHRRLELDPDVSGVWPGLRAAFRAVASPRVRNVATMGGVLADADYASDPPSMLVASNAVAEVASVRGTRRIPIEELIVGHYTTTLAGGRADHPGRRARGPTGPRRTASCGPAPRRTAPPRRSPPCTRGHRARRRRRGERPAAPLRRRLRRVEARRRGERPRDRRGVRRAASTTSTTTAAPPTYRRTVVGVEVRRALMAVGA